MSSNLDGEADIKDEMVSASNYLYRDPHIHYFAFVRSPDRARSRLTVCCILVAAFKILTTVGG